MEPLAEFESALILIRSQMPIQFDYRGLFITYNIYRSAVRINKARQPIPVRLGWAAQIGMYIIRTL